MARFVVRVTENFIEELACIDSERIVARLQMILESLCGNPTMGARNENQLVEQLIDLAGRFSYSVAAYEVLYRYDGAVVELLGMSLLPPAKQ